MKTLFPYPVTTPPEKNGVYITNIGAMSYDLGSNYWYHVALITDEQPTEYMSESMPPELAKVLESIKSAVDLNLEYRVLSKDDCKLLLTHLTNQEE